MCSPEHARYIPDVILRPHCYLIHLFRKQSGQGFGTDSTPLTNLKKHLDKSFIRRQFCNNHEIVMPKGIVMGEELSPGCFNDLLSF